MDNNDLAIWEFFDLLFHEGTNEVQINESILDGATIDNTFITEPELSEDEGIWFFDSHNIAIVVHTTAYPITYTKGAPSEKVYQQIIIPAGSVVAELDFIDGEIDQQTRQITKRTMHERMQSILRGVKGIHEFIETIDGKNNLNTTDMPYPEYFIADANYDIAEIISRKLHFQLFPNGSRYTIPSLAKVNDVKTSLLAIDQQMKDKGGLVAALQSRIQRPSNIAA